MENYMAPLGIETVKRFSYFCKYWLRLDRIISFAASNGVVLATENKHKSILYEEHSVHKVEMITQHIGMIYSGEYKFCT
jgi:20S proteasome alpha/beta subunit